MPRPSAVRFTRILVTLAGILVMLLFGAVPRAEAHAQLTATNPANGALLAAAPAKITLRFSEAVLLVDGGIRLVGPRGPVATPGPARIDAASSEQVDVPVPARLDRGVYTVSWRVVSADSHPVYGAFVFGIGDVRIGQLPVAGAQTGTAPTLSAVFPVFRWLGYAALALLAGGAGFLLTCWRAGWSRPRVRRLLTAAWATGLGSAAALFLLQGPNAAGGSLTDAFDPRLVAATLGTDFGRFSLARVAFLLAGGVLLRAAVWAGAARPPLALALAATLGIALPATWTGTGHANAHGDPLVAAVTTVHLAAMATWLGGLAVLVCCVLPKTAAVGVAEMRAAVTRFSPIAAGSVAVIVVTGTYRAWIEVGSPAALVGTEYGALLVFKLATLGVLLWFAAMSRSVVRRRYMMPANPVEQPEPATVGAGAPKPKPKPRQVRAEAERESAARGQLRWTLRFEAGLAAAVLALTSALVATPPGSRPAPGGVGEQDAEVALGDGRAVLRLDPARVGPSTLTVRVLDRSGNARQLPEVTLTLRLPSRCLGPLPVTLTGAGPGTYRSQRLIVPMAGDWQARLVVRTSDIDEETATATMPVR